MESVPAGWRSRGASCQPDLRRPTYQLAGAGVGGADQGRRYQMDACGRRWACARCLRRQISSVSAQIPPVTWRLSYGAVRVA